MSQMVAWVLATHCVPSAYSHALAGCQQTYGEKEFSPSVHVLAIWHKPRDFAGDIGV
jgi:hypothetical protein